MHAPTRLAPALRAPEHGTLPLLAYLAVCIVWGSTFLAIRIGVETIPPWTMIGARCLIAGLLLAGFALVRGARLPGPRGLASAAASGFLLFACSQSMLAWAELRVPTGTAAVLACTVSLLTPLVSWLIGAAGRPNWRAAAGLLVGFAGVAVLARPQVSGADPAATGVLMLSAVAWSLGAALARRVPPAGSALLGSGLQLLAGCPGALAVACARGEWRHFDPAQITARSALAMTYLIVMGSLLAFACFGWLVQIWRPERLSTYAFVNPVVALILGALVLGEAVGAREVGATVMILGAVGMVMWGNRKAG